MFFLARSALCIGLVAAAASTAGGSTLGTTFDGAPRDVARAAGEACLRSADCLRIGAEILATAVPLAPHAATRASSPSGPARMPAPRRAGTTRNGDAPKG